VVEVLSGVSKESLQIIKLGRWSVMSVFIIPVIQVMRFVWLLVIMLSINVEEVLVILVGLLIVGIRLC